MNSENIANYWVGMNSVGGKSLFYIKSFQVTQRCSHYWKPTEHTSILQVCRVQNKKLAVSNYRVGYIMHDHHV